MPECESTVCAPDFPVPDMHEDDSAERPHRVDSIYPSSVDEMSSDDEMDGGPPKHTDAPAESDTDHGHISDEDSHSASDDALSTHSDLDNMSHDDDSSDDQVADGSGFSNPFEFRMAQDDVDVEDSEVEPPHLQAPRQSTSTESGLDTDAVLNRLLTVVSALGLPLRCLANKMLSYFPSIVQRLTVVKYFVLLLLLKWAVRWNISASAASAVFRIVSVLWAFFTVTPFPHNFAQACKELNVTGDFASATYYIMCPICGALTLKDQAGARCGKTKDCRGKLMQKTDTIRGQTRWVVPTSQRLIYPGVIRQLQKLLSRTETRAALSWYLKRPSPGPDVLIDIWDGAVFQEWKTVLKPNGLQHWFCSDVTPDVFFQLNGDSFNPFTSGQYSVCALYLTLANLPREVRFLEENTILVCLVPGVGWITCYESFSLSLSHPIPSTHYPLLPSRYRHHYQHHRYHHRMHSIHLHLSYHLQVPKNHLQINWSTLCSH